MFALCAVVAMAQDGKISVKFQGASPNILDFAWAYFCQDNGDEEEDYSEAMSGIRVALDRFKNDENQNDDVTLTVDRMNGFLSYEFWHQGNQQIIEMCYWNEADKQHKLVAISRWNYFNSLPSRGQFDGITFLRYNNATKQMTYCQTPGFEVVYEVNTTYSLPRTGKNIMMNTWDEGLKTQTPLKWNGHGFDAPATAQPTSQAVQKWASMMDYNEGLAPVMNDEQYWGFVDKTGRLVIPCRYRQVGSFSEGLAYVSEDYQFYGYIDKTGRLVIPMDFKEAGNFKNGKAEVTTENNKPAIINKSGRIIKF